MADFLAVIVLAVSVLMIFAWYRVICKMGFPGWYIVIFLIPIAGPFFFLYLAFAEWPIEKQISDARFHARMAERAANPLPGGTPLPGQVLDLQGERGHPEPLPQEHQPRAGTNASN